MGSIKFHEEIHLFHRIFNLLFMLPALMFIWVFIQDVMLGVSLGEVISKNIALLVISLIFAIVGLLFGRMVIEVDGGDLKIGYGYLGLIEKRIPVSEIEKAEVISYSPLRQFGGWGIRSGKFRGERVGCYSLKGSRGVLLTLSGSVRVCVIRVRKLIIGSQMPEILLEAILPLDIHK